MNDRVLVTGGGGYIGTNLVNFLLKKNYKVTVIDTFWFGNYLKKNKNLSIIEKDIRNISPRDFKNISTIIHLASIANDPAGDLDATLTWDVNVLATYKLINLAIKQKVKKFIFASSGSVYGIKKERKVTENLSLEPVSEYNKSKMICERVLLSYKSFIDLTILRPATVCGFSESMRLDVAVNALTYNALSQKKIKVFGGKQIRPNLNMDDMILAYYFFLKKKINRNKSEKKIIFNVGFENLSILKIAKKVNYLLKFKSEIKIEKSNDIRSYRQNSERLLKYGFSPKSGIKDAIYQLEKEYADRRLLNNKKFYRINTLKIIKKSKKL